MQLEVELLRQELLDNLVNLSLSPLYDQNLNYKDTIQDFVFRLSCDHVQHLCNKCSDPSFLSIILKVIMRQYFW